MNFTSPALVDQGCQETLKSGKAKEKAREDDEGVSCSLHRLVVEESGDWTKDSGEGSAGRPPSIGLAAT